MDTQELIGMRVLNKHTQLIGIIEYICNGVVAVNFHGEIVKYAFPAAFASLLEAENPEIQRKIQSDAIVSSFELFKKDYGGAIKKEIAFIKKTGGKKYRIIDGEKIAARNDEYLYAFDSDTDFHFPDDTAIKLWFPDKIISGYIVSCEEFTILIRTSEYLGEKIDSVEFSAEQWQLLEALMERLDEMNPNQDALAYDIACNGKKQISVGNALMRGQNLAFKQATSEGITFIWGPPGTGKTETLSNIALEHISNGKRVLMLSYSNVSVDGALLRVAKRADYPEGTIIRYGYPRTKELIEDKTLTSYNYVLYKNPDKAAEYSELIERKKKLKKKDPERVKINRLLNRIREYLSDQERELIQQAAFVATTVSKATVDAAVYLQKFDVVIFDEASMAYVPQIVFSANLAKKHFVCIGDFYQLPAIVQNRLDDTLSRDIFEYTGITNAVENGKNHKWLVMLDVQYRMHRDISDFVSKYMYHNMLKTSDRIYESRMEIASCHPCVDSAMSLIDLSGMYSVCTKTNDGSRINIMSALMCLRVAEKIIEQHEVGIITPYSAQSRLLLSMIRDIQECDKKWLKVTCATVHQFQGSEKPVIIYDAVDCFRMSYPGMLLSTMKNDMANRLFNVAITRAKGKIVLVANMDYLKRKKISKKLIFTKYLQLMMDEGDNLFGNDVIDEMTSFENEKPQVYVDNREESFEKYIDDVKIAKTSIHIDIPDVIDDNDKLIKGLLNQLDKKNSEGVDICIRLPDNVDLPKGFSKYIVPYAYTANPITIIDKNIIWFGQPLYAADFISEGDILDTEYFPCIRFSGKHAARSIQAFLEM